MTARWRWIGAGLLLATILAAWFGAARLKPIAASPYFFEPSAVQRMIGLEPSPVLPGPLPTGRSIIVGHVEAGASEFMPDQTDPALQGIRFISRSGRSQVSGHATATAKVIYGRQGLAPGVSEVELLSSDGWMTRSLLQAHTRQPPGIATARLYSHSWISNPQGEQGERLARAVLRRMDAVTDQQGTLFVTGVGNADSKVPVLAASAYNNIAVGQWEGHSSGGYTRFEAPGRCKPDLVAPHHLTSFSTPVVAALAARLLELADQSADPDDARPQVIKAAILAGAQRPANWNPAPGHPLDEYLGAGQVHFGSAMSILRAGQPQALELAHRGWKYRSIEPGAKQAYDLTLDAPSPLSLVLVWHRRIDGRVLPDLITGEVRWIDQPRLADLDLTLQGPATTAASRSKIDNVELIHLRQAPAGQYRIEVQRMDSLDEPWDYALAWRTGE